MNAPRPPGGVWKLEDAKAHFSELVRRARSEGPQRVTRRGKAAVVVLSAEAYARLQPETDGPGLVRFLQRSGFDELELTREPDFGREIDL